MYHAELVYLLEDAQSAVNLAMVWNAPVNLVTCIK